MQLTDLADALSKFPDTVLIAIGLPVGILAVFLYFRGKNTSPSAPITAPLLDVPKHHFDGPMKSALDLFQRLVEANEQHPDLTQLVADTKKFILDRVEARIEQIEARTRKSEQDIARIEGMLQRSHPRR